MKIYKCDVCGEEIEQKELALSKSYQTSETGLFGVICQNRHVCKTCHDIGRSLDFEKSMLDYRSSEVLTQKVRTLVKEAHK